VTTAGQRRRGAFWPIAVLAFLVAGSIVVLERIDRRGGPRRGAATTERRSPQQPPRRVPRAAPAPKRGTGPLPGEDDQSEPDGDWVPVPEGPARVAIVIDDVGFEEGPALELARLRLPITFAILPHQRYSRSLALELVRMGHQVILHLPMEPLDYPERNPGRGAVREGMTPEQITAIVSDDLDAVPGAVGLNNHMGSLVTADPRMMGPVLEVVRRRGLFFLDSRTTDETVAYDLARAMGLRAVKRSIFLDDTREASYIEAQVRGLLKKAREQGSALAIGHADPVTVQVLKRSVPMFRSEDIRVVPASELAAGGQGGSG
jgi:uncharacterized protein